jgi:hypothetical protein
MPRPRKPTQLHFIQGTLNRTRHKDRKGEPVGDAPIGPAPADWPLPTVEVWNEIVRAIPEGVATAADRLIIELTTRLTIKMRSKGECTPAFASQLRCCLASLGLTPSDRSRVTTGAAERLTDPAARYFRDLGP